MPRRKATLLLAALGLASFATLLMVHVADRAPSVDQAAGRQLDAATPVAIPATGSSAADTPQPCVQLPAHEAYLCVSRNAFQTKDGAVYWTDYKFTRQIYWHPYGDDHSKYLTVTESYFCGPNDFGRTATEAWCEFRAPGVGANTPEWQRRVITVVGPYGAQCVIYHWNVLDSLVSPPAPTRCLDLQTGKLRSTTANEKTSVLRFWQEAQEMPGAW